MESPPTFTVKPNAAHQRLAGGMKNKSATGILGILLMIFGMIVVLFSITDLIVQHQIDAILSRPESEEETILAGFFAAFASLVAGIILIITSEPRE